MRLRIFLMALQSDRLKQRRRILKLSQEQLAELTGVNQPQVSRWELGENDITGTTLTALARALNTTANWRLGLSDNPFPMATNGSAFDTFAFDLVTAVRAVKLAHRHILLVLANGQINQKWHNRRYGTTTI